MLNRPVLTAAVVSFLALAACGRSDDTEPTSTEAPAPATDAARSPARGGNAIPGYPHMPAAWQQNRGLIIGRPQGFEVWGAWLKQNPQMIDNPSVQAALADLYSCADGERARGNEIERASIYQAASRRFREFLATTPNTVTVTVGNGLGDWSATDSAFGWKGHAGASTMEPIRVTVIPGDPEAFRYTCGIEGGGIFAPDLYAHYTALPPLRMSQAQASQLLDQIGNDRFMQIAITFDLASARGPDPEAATDHPGGIRTVRMGPIPPFNGYFRSAIVRTTDGKEVARF